MMALRFAAIVGLLLLGACAEPLVVPMGPPAGAPRLLDDRLVMADGAELPLKRWLPEATPRAVILGLRSEEHTSELQSH